MAEGYLLPNSLTEALATLERCGGAGRIIAGGTDLMIDLKEGRRPICSLVDITRIPELNGIRQLDAETIWIGATTTHRQVWESPLIQTYAAVLAQACRSVGALQIQNVGTLGGNVVNAMPAADGSIALTALSAEAEVATSAGRRWLPLSEVFSRPGVCRIQPTTEILTGFRFHVGHRRSGSAFQRLSRRRALSLPVLNCGAVVQLDDAGERILTAAVALGPVAPTPWRARAAEEILAGAPATAENLRQAGQKAMEGADPRSNPLRGSREYRREMIAVLTRRALEQAVAAARASH